MRAQTRKTEASPKRGKPREPRGRTPATAPQATAPQEKPRARLKRSPSARTAPIRDASMMFRSAPFSTSAEEREKGKKAPPRDVDPPGPGGSPGMKGAVEHSVEMAYRVIDELLQRGRRAAGRASHPSTKADPVRNNQNSNLAGMMMQTWMDMGRMWFGMMGPLMLGGFSPWQQGSGFGGAYPPGRAGQSYEGSATNTDGRMKVTLDLRSDRPTEVMIDLNRLSASQKKLSLQALREKHEAQGKPAIAGVDITHHEDGAIRLSVNIPAGQPHGLYTGAISTEDGTPVGAVSVKIHQIHGQSEHARHEPAA